MKQINIKFTVLTEERFGRNLFSINKFLLQQYLSTIPRTAQKSGSSQAK